MRKTSSGSKELIADTLLTLGVVHGDLKPDNCLVFQGDVVNKFVTKVSDFGFSSIWARPDDLIQVSKTEPWSAPEWHHRGFVFCEARKMDVYSFGLLCLWIMVQSPESGLERPIQDIKALLFTAEGEFEVGVLGRLKVDGSLGPCLIQILRQEGPPKNPELLILLQVLQGALQANIGTRDSGLSDLITVLDGGIRPPRENIEGTYFFSSSEFSLNH